MSLDSVMEILRPGGILEQGPIASVCADIEHRTKAFEKGLCCLFTHLVSTTALRPRLSMHSFIHSFALLDKNSLSIKYLTEL